jgi:hypothetical protein
MSLTQIPVIGDAHLHPGPRQADRLRALDQIIGAGLQLPALGAWAWPGDVCHARSHIEDRNAVADRAVRMAQRAPLIVCYGNHDQPGDLDIFAKLGAHYPIYVIDRPQVLRVSLATGDPLTVFVLPYPHPAGLVAAGTPPSEVVGAARAMLEAIFIDAGVKLEAARQQRDLTLFLAHANIAGAIVSTGQPQIGHEIELDAALLWRLGDCPKVLNHIHKAQAIGGGRFGGSICRLNWGEIEEKGYLVVEYGPVPEEPSRDWELQWRPIDVPPMYHVEATYAQQAFTYDVQPDTIPKGSEVRVRARFPQSERTFFEMGKAQLFADFAHAGRLEVEPVCVADRGLRAPEVAAAKTLYEKLVAWCHVNGLEPPDGLADAVAALEHREPEKVIAEFTAQMEALVRPQVDESAEYVG